MSDAIVSTDRLSHSRKKNFSMETDDHSTGLGQYHITDTWTDHLEGVRMDYQERARFKSEVAREKQRLKDKAYIAYAPEKLKSIMIGSETQKVRQEVMANVEFQRLLMQNLHEIKRKKRGEILK